VLEDKNLVNELVWKVANGEIPSVEAAKQCGLSYQVFYKRLRKNREAFAVFREKVSKRKRPLVDHKYNYQFKRDSDDTRAERLAKVMNEYYEKCKLADKEIQAKKLGMSYGQYVAFAEGYGRIGD
jgi:hypothetical protein